MQYEVKDITWVTVPKKKESDNSILEVNVQVKSGIVGDTHGFTKTDIVPCSFPMSITITQAEASVISQASQFVAEKYPNT